MEHDTWYQLQKLCPNVVCFNYINNRYNNDTLGGSGQWMDYQLEHTPAWLTHTYHNNLFKDHLTLWPLLTYLPLCHSEDLGKLIVKNQLSKLSNNHPIDNINKNNKNDHGIDDNADKDNNNPFQFQSSINYIGTTLHDINDYTSFTKTLSFYQHLTKLHIDFIHLNTLRDRLRSNIDCSSFFNQLDVCHCLEHLSVNYLSLIMDPSQENENSNSNQNNNKIEIPHSNMKILSLHHLEVKHPDCFYFISKKYPQLHTLDIQLSITRELTNLLLDRPHFSDGYQQRLYYLFTNYPLLQILWFGIEDTFDEEDMLHYDQKIKLIVPLTQMMDWFEQNRERKSSSFSITQLKWPYELYKDHISSSSTTTTTTTSSSSSSSSSILPTISVLPNYLNKLTTLDITLADQSPNQQLIYLLKGDRHKTLSTSITSLKLKDLSPKLYSSGLELHHWLHALPNLKKLELSDMECIQYDHYLDNELTVYGLEELIMRKISLYSQLGLRGNKNATVIDICQLFPKLKILKLDEVSILGSQYLNRLLHLYNDENEDDEVDNDNDDNDDDSEGSIIPSNKKNKKRITTSTKWNEDDIILSEFVDQCLKEFPMESIKGMKSNKRHHIGYRRMCDQIPPLAVLDFSHLSLDTLYLSNVRIYASLKHNEKYHYRRLLIEALHVYEQQEYKRHQKTTHFTIHSEDRDDDFHYYYNEDDPNFDHQQFPGGFGFAVNNNNNHNNRDENEHLNLLNHHHTNDSNNSNLIPHLNHQEYGSWNNAMGSMSIAIKCQRIGQVYLNHSKKYWSTYVNETRKECFEHVFKFIETIVDHRLTKRKEKKEKNGKE
ncbi:unnamed protein product [Cunninghamella blakesleeana]